MTQDFLEYVHEKQDEEEGEGGGRRERRNRPPPPPYPGDEEGDGIPHLTTSDMVSFSYDPVHIIKSIKRDYEIIDLPSRVNFMIIILKVKFKLGQFFTRF